MTASCPASDQQRIALWRRFHRGCWWQCALEQCQPHLHLPRSDRQDLGIAQCLHRRFYIALAQKNEDGGSEVAGFLNFSNTSPVSTGNAWADFLVGRIANYTQVNQQLKYYYRDKVFEPYIQDDWHVSKKLTLNLGLRMSGFGAYTNRYNQFYNFYPVALQSRASASDRRHRQNHRRARRLGAGCGEPVQWRGRLRHGRHSQ